MTQRRPSDFLIILMLGLLSLISPFTVDMYLPAFSRIAGEFHTSTAVISFTLSTYFIGFALGQVIYGPLLDHFGRKRPLYFGMAFYLLASLGLIGTHSVHSFILLRLIEALGGGVTQVAAIAMVRDFFPVERSARVFSMLFLTIGVSPLLAPTLGSLLMDSLGWRWIFAILAILGLVILLLVAFLLPEGHTPDHSIVLRPMPIALGFVRILAVPQFLVYALAGACSFAGLFTYVAGSPILFMDGFHMDAKAFGITFAVLTGGFIGGNQLNVLMLRWFRSGHIFLGALAVQVISGIIFFTGVHMQVLDLTSVMILLFVFLSCIGLTYPNAAAIALAPFTRDAGSAAALLGFLQTGTGALVSTGIGLMGTFSIPAQRSGIASLLAGTAVLALLILFLGRTAAGKIVEAENSAPILH